jgi:glycosyltransferase involved in cell wall biosynthesis
MKVAIFTDNDFGKVNGVTTTLRAVLDHAPDTLDIRVYTCETEGIETPDYLGLSARGCGIPYYREMKVYWPPFRRFLRHATAAGIDVVHYTTPGPVGLAAIWVARRLNIPIVGSFHTDLAEYTRVLSGWDGLGDLMHLYMRWSYGKCDRIFAPSESTREMLVRGRIDAAKIDVWRRGVETTRFDPSRRSAALRDTWGASDGRPALLYVGRVSREKGLSLLEPLRRFLEEHGTAHRLVVVGDGPMRAELHETCRNAFFTGALSPDDVAVAMASADAFVFPSRTDTAGNVVLEAQASGLPVLVSDAGGPHENIRPDHTGFVCNTFEDFARRATELLRSRSKRQQMSAAAREYALTRSWESALAPLYRAYADTRSSTVSASEPLGARAAAFH